MAITPQQDTKIIKGRDDTRQLHAIDQEDRQWVLALPYGIEKEILQVLGAFCHFFYLSPIHWESSQSENDCAPEQIVSSFCTTTRLSP